MPGKRRSEGMTGQGRARGAAVMERKRDAGPVVVPSSAASVRPSVVVGRLMPGSTAEAPLVEFAGNPRGPTRARTTVSMDAATLARAVMAGQGVVLVFENGDPQLPIVTGLIGTGQPATPFQELLASPRAVGPERGASAFVEARLDGERVVLEGRREVVLRCGEASITLRSDGKVLLRGAYVETYAKGVNRIKGASVKIN